MLTDNLDDLHKLAKGLLEFETLNGDEIKALLRGEPIIRSRPPEDDDQGKPKSSVPSGGDISGDEVPQGA